MTNKLSMGAKLQLILYWLLLLCTLTIPVFLHAEMMGKLGGVEKTYTVLIPQDLLGVGKYFTGVTILKAEPNGVWFRYHGTLHFVAGTFILREE